MQSTSTLTSAAVSTAPKPRSPRGTRARRAHDVPSLGLQLERDRLERRAARVKQVIHALRERADARHGSAPRPLLAAIEGFGRELTEIERQLRRVGDR